MTFDFSSLDEELRFGARELAAECGAREGKGIKIVAKSADRLTVKREKGAYVIGFSARYEFFRGLAKAFAGKECEEKSRFSHLTFMADCSRNAVPTVSTLKRLVRLLAAAGYDRLQLYTEDTYEIAGRPMFGYMRGAYTEEELKETDAYARALGIELIPCIQTLAHLATIFRWKEFYPMCDCNDILLCGDEDVYKLIDDMFAQLERSFTSRVAHIGMDEAHMVGLGKYLDQHGYENRFDIINRHLARVLQIAKKHGFTCYMWGDMFFRLAFGGEYYRFDKEIPPEVAAAIPKDVNLIYWDYYQTDKAVYDGMIASYKKLGNPMSFAGGAWKWSGFAPCNEFSLAATELALDSCLEHGVDDVTATAWGDNGAEASLFSVLPCLVYYGERRYGEKAGESFRAVTGCAFEDFLALELPDRVRRTMPEPAKSNYSKILLYNDPLLGMFDDLASRAEEGAMRENLGALRAARGRIKGSFRYLFDTLCALSEAVLAKYSLGNELREAYLKGDREVLATLCGRMKDAERKLAAFHRALSAQWYRENKPEGMEVQDIRLGGACTRMRECRQRVQAYLAGKTDSLPELAAERNKEFQEDQFGIVYNSWAQIVSACPF